MASRSERRRSARCVKWRAVIECFDGEREVRGFASYSEAMKCLGIYHAVWLGELEAFRAYWLVDAAGNVLHRVTSPFQLCPVAVAVHAPEVEARHA